MKKTGGGFGGTSTTAPILEAFGRGTAPPPPDVRRTAPAARPGDFNTDPGAGRGGPGGRKRRGRAWVGGTGSRTRRGGGGKKLKGFRALLSGGKAIFHRARDGETLQQEPADVRFGDPPHAAPAQPLRVACD